MIDRRFAKHKEELSGFRKPTKKEKKYIKNILIEDNILNSSDIIYTGLSGKILMVMWSITLFVALFYLNILLFGSNAISLGYAIAAWIIINIVLYIYSRTRFNDLLGGANALSLFAVRLGIYKVLPCFIVSFENDSTKTRVYIRTDKDDYCSDVLFCNRSFYRSDQKDVGSNKQDYLLNSKLYLIKSIGGYTLC